jgi:hypothetical protein
MAAAGDGDAGARFAARASAYCDFIAGAAALSLDERLAAARTHLLALYEGALALAQRDEDFDVEPPESPPRPADWPGMGTRDVYWLVFDPFDHDDVEPVCGSLNDDLLDVYADVHRGLALWNAGHREAALWHWRFDFNSHWGAHTIQALGALHTACAWT